MRYLIIFFALMFLSSALCAQRGDLSILKKQLLKQVDSLQKHKPLDDYNGNWIASLEKEFYIDTFYVEHLLGLEMNEDGSTMGMVQALQNAELGYDSLLNKYYKKMLNRLAGDDKLKLKESQRNWVKFRDSEKQLNYTLYKEEYSDGGTIHKIFVSDKEMQITKTRLIEIYFYLDRIWRN